MTANQRALSPPTEDLAIMNQRRMDQVIAASRVSPRRRVVLPLHRSEDELLHRMLNAIQPDSYVRPHRHLEPPKAEAWILLRGSLLFLTFDDDGRVRDRLVLSHGSDTFGVDLVPGIYHTVVALEPDTVIYEVKTGPYQQASDKSFAPWAPEEDSPDAPHYLAQLAKS